MQATTTSDQVWKQRWANMLDVLGSMDHGDPPVYCSSQQCTRVEFMSIAFDPEYGGWEECETCKGDFCKECLAAHNDDDDCDGAKKKRKVNPE